MKAFGRVYPGEKEGDGMRYGNRVWAMLLACLLASVLLMSIFFLIWETDHECQGDNCAVCAVLIVCERLLRESFAPTLAVLGGLYCLRCAWKPAKSARVVFESRTPVLLKVKLSD